MKPQFLQTKKEIEDWLKALNIQNWTLHPAPQGSPYPYVIDALEVDLRLKDLLTVPVKFRYIEKDFDCSHNYLSNLNFAPDTVAGSFDCSRNGLTTLVGGPQKVGEDYFCFRNQLTSLLGISTIIPGHFDCSVNQITSLQEGPKEVGGCYVCNHNQLTDLVGVPIEIKNEFNCSHNKLTTLRGGPRVVQQDFKCGHNQLTTLKFCPSSTGRLYAEDNALKHLAFLPETVGHPAAGPVYFRRNPLLGPAQQFNWFVQAKKQQEKDLIVLERKKLEEKLSLLNQNKTSKSTLKI